MVHRAPSHPRAGCLNTERLNRTFAALADPTRRAAVELLRRGPRRAGELASALASTPAGLSRHLRILRETGLVVEEIDPEDARARLLRLERAPLELMRDWISDIEAFWTDQLAAFKAHAESKRKR